MKIIITQNQTIMEKYTNEELLDVLGSCLRESKELTPKQKAVLGQLYVYDGLNKKDKDGYFYRSNKDLCNDCDIKEEKTLIAAVRKLVLLGFIDTVRGSRKDGASLYRINRKVIDDYCKTPVKEESQVTPDTDSIGVEITHIPTEEEQFQEWLQVTAPYLKELESVKTQVQLEYMWKKLAQVGREYLDNHEETSPNVIQRMNKTVCSAFRNKKEELAPSEMDLSEYLSRQHNYGSL